MKTIVAFLIIAIGGMATFSGCKKSSEHGTAMTATIGGTPFYADNCIFGYHLLVPQLDTTRPYPVTLSIQGFEGATGTCPYILIDITVDSANPTGTYTTTAIHYLGIQAIGLVSSATIADYGASGTVVITSATDSLITGTFSYLAGSGKEVTDGKFTAKLYP